MRRASHFFLVAMLAIIAGSVQAQTTPRTTQRKAPPKAPAKPVEPAVPPVDLPAEPGLYAVIYTSMGNIVCKLLENVAPKAVENFRGLAMGTKAWTDPVTGKVKHTSLYTGTTFHRVIPKFMIQGGDPTGDGSGSPGYKFDDEIDPKFSFDHAGYLAMANSGPNTNASQFFITVAPADWLNGKFTMFGEVVSGQEVADAISEVPRDSNDKPLNPVKLIRIIVRRVEAKPAPAN